MSDPIADMLTRIRNAQLVEKKEVNVPNSKIKLAIVKVLKEEGYIDNYRVNQLDNSKKSEIVITLKYYLGDPVIESVVRISKPGLRQYKSSLKLTKGRIRRESKSGHNVAKKKELENKKR